MLLYFRHNEMTLTDFYHTLESDVESPLALLVASFKLRLDDKDAHDGPDLRPEKAQPQPPKTLPSRNSLSRHVRHSDQPCLKQ